MIAALDTLFLPFTNGLLDINHDRPHMLFMNGHIHPDFQVFNRQHTDIIQFFKPYAFALEEDGYSVMRDASKLKEDHYDTVLCLATKNQRETEYLLANCATSLKDDGLMVIAADNKSGGTRLKKMLEKLGFEDIAEQSKNKARVVWARKGQMNEPLLKDWLVLGQIQEIADNFQSCLGLYGWDKIDKGSQILAAHFPTDLKGKGADFGCGYGYLSQNILEKNRKIKALDYIDADFRALEMCELNIERFDILKQGLWLDLTKPQKELHSRYDWIVMNPPFHEGKKTASDIGQTFIKTASQSLRKKGQLWMVANAHLPYEGVLEEHFFNYKSVFQGQGFKVFCAYK